MTALVAELTAPALFVAGATTSLHCALMCGAINAAQAHSRGPVPLREALALVHAGRVLGYALLGMLAGALGGQLASWLPDALGGRVLQGLATLALVAAGIRQWRGGKCKKGDRTIFSPKARPCHAGRGKIVLSPFFLPPRGRLFAQGLLWALMPCGILYMVLLLAGFSGSAVAGCFLLAAFGLGTVPLMGLSGGLAGWAARPQHARGLRQGAGAMLVALGLAGLGVIALHGGVPELWCLPGR